MNVFVNDQHFSISNNKDIRRQIKKYWNKRDTFQKLVLDSTGFNFTSDHNRRIKNGIATIKLYKVIVFTTNCTKIATVNRDTGDYYKWKWNKTFPYAHLDINPAFKYPK